MFIVESSEKAFDVAKPLLSPDQGAKVRLDAFVAQLLRVLIRGPQSLGRTVNVLVCQHRFESAAQAALRRHRQKRFEGFGRPVVVRVAVGESEGAPSFWVQRRKDLRNSAAT